jgi:hypothetical protein
MTKQGWTLLLPILLAASVSSAAAQSIVTIQNRRPPEPLPSIPRVEPGSNKPRPAPFGPMRQQDRRYQEPAFSRGYTDGYRRGIDDSRDRDRYDPVGHGDYKRADQGYYRDYGSRDAYRNNYRAGFRQGYEEGYRAGEQRR